MLRARFVLVAAVAALAVASAAVSWAGSEKTVGQSVLVFRADHVVQMPATHHPIQKLAGRVILLQFFSTYSERESDAVPHLNKLRDRLGPRGLTILAATAAEKDKFEGWMKEFGALYSACCIDSTAYDKLLRFYEYPGMPWSYLIDVHGTIVWQGHPQACKARRIEGYLAPTSAAPRLPAELAEQQRLLDAGQWASAATALLEVAATEGTDTRIRLWAKDTAAWIKGRSLSVFDEAKKLEGEGAWWDAWEIYTDYAKRFEGLEETAKAAAMAEAVRANPAAKADLELGDRVARAGDLLERGKQKKAMLIINRILKKYRDTRHGRRCKALLNPLD